MDAGRELLTLEAAAFDLVNSDSRQPIITIATHRPLSSPGAAPHREVDAYTVITSSATYGDVVHGRTERRFALPLCILGCCLPLSRMLLMQ